MVDFSARLKIYHTVDLSGRLYVNYMDDRRAC